MREGSISSGGSRNKKIPEGLKLYGGKGKGEKSKGNVLWQVFRDFKALPDYFQAYYQTFKHF